MNRQNTKNIFLPFNLPLYNDMQTYMYVEIEEMFVIKHNNKIKIHAVKWLIYYLGLRFPRQVNDYRLKVNTMT